MAASRPTIIRVSVLLTLLVSVVSGHAQDQAAPLPSRGFLGARLVAAPAEAPARVLVDRIIPGGTAAAADLRPGDLLAEVDGVAMPDPLTAAAAIARRPPGSIVPLTILRDGRDLTLDAPLVARPMEQGNGMEVLYDAVPVNTGRLRSILLKPPGPGPFPAVLHVQGLSCSSIDYAFSPTSPTKQLVDGMTAAGFVTMRVEKSGVGESEGPPCVDLGLHEEAAGFLAALRSLKRYDFVDADRVFLFGHSMGGVIAPMIVAREPVRGVVVYGTIAKPFIEYMIENQRRQDELEGRDLIEIDTDTRARLRFMHHLYVERLSRSEIFAMHPDLSSLGQYGFSDDAHQFGRSVEFFRELAALNIAAAWGEVDAHVLAVHGEFDWVSGEADHALIADVVNARRPGTASWITLERSDHGYQSYDTLEASFVDRRTGPFNPQIVRTCVEWMRVTGR